MLPYYIIISPKWKEKMGRKEKLTKIDGLKSEMDNIRPLPEDILCEFRKYYSIGLTYASNAIEGNTLTESETKVVIEDGITIGGKTIREHLEVIGHAEAYQEIYGIVKKSKIEEQDILLLHRLIMFRIDPEQAGKYRDKNIFITGTDYIPPDNRKVPELMASHVKKLNKQPPAGQHPVEWISRLHADFESIHPFKDGNGRVGRLVLNILSLKHGYCPVVIPPIRRAEYITAMRNANKGDYSHIQNLIINTVYEEMKVMVRMAKRIRGQQNFPSQGTIYSPSSILG
jgi:Fic family protein